MPKHINLKVSTDCDIDCTSESCECDRLEENIVKLMRLLEAPGSIERLSRMIEADRVWDELEVREASR